MSKEIKSLIFIDDEPMAQYFCKWVGWFVIMILFVWILIYVVDVNNCSIDGLKDHFDPKKQYLMFAI